MTVVARDPNIRCFTRCPVLYTAPKAPSHASSITPIARQCYRKAVLRRLHFRPENSGLNN